MAKTYRTEREILTIDLTVKLPKDLRPGGVRDNQAVTLKISAYPAVWRWLRENSSGEGDPREVDNLIAKAIQEAHNKLPIKNIKKNHIREDDFDKAFTCLANRSDRISKGVHYRGRHKSNHGLTDDLREKAKWIYWLFLYWNKHKAARPENILTIYAAVRAKAGSAKLDTVAMTYCLCQIYYEEDFTRSGATFPARDSFRSTYLRVPRIRTKKTPEEVVGLIEKEGHPLNVITKICRKLQK